MELFSLGMVVAVKKKEFPEQLIEPEVAQSGLSYQCRRPCCRRLGFLVLVPDLRHWRGDLSVQGLRSPPLKMTRAGRARDPALRCWSLGEGVYPNRQAWPPG